MCNITCQIMCQLLFAYTPLPVMPQRRWIVHAGFFSKAQIILKRDHAIFSDTGHRHPDQIFTKFFIGCMRTVHILPDMVAHMLLRALQILHQCLIIVSSCIYNRIRCIIVRQIFIVTATAKCKLQHLHTRITGFSHQIPDRLRHISKILRNDFYIFHMLFHFMK